MIIYFNKVPYYIKVYDEKGIIFYCADTELVIVLIDIFNMRTI